MGLSQYISLLRQLGLNGNRIGILRAIIWKISSFLENWTEASEASFLRWRSPLTHELINYIDTTAKCRHLKKLTSKGTWRRVFISVYRPPPPLPSSILYWTVWYDPWTEPQLNLALRTLCYFVFVIKEIKMKKTLMFMWIFEINVFTSK